MNCYKCKQLIDKIHIDCINDNELQSVLRHIDECEECRTYYNVMNEMIEGINSFEEVELPEGFHNKLHFALKREAAAPSRNTPSLVKGLKIAAIGTCSVLVVMAAVALLPGRMTSDAMPNMAMEEAMEAESAEYSGADMEMQAMDDAADMPMATELTAPEEAPVEKEWDNTLDGDAAEEASEETDDIATACSSLTEAASMVIIINTEDIQAVYDDLLQYFPDNLPETSWPFADIEEPEVYLQLRQVMDRDVAEHLAGDLASDYGRELELYAARVIEYDNWKEEIANLQNIGYIYIVIK